MRTLDTQLFVGGPLDGARKATDPMLTTYVHEERPQALPAFGLGALSRTRTMPSRTIYRRESVSAVQVELQLWVAPGLEPWDVMRLLIENYPPEKP